MLCRHIVWFLCGCKLHELESGLAKRLDGFCFLLILVDMALIERAFGETTGMPDGGKFFLMGFIWLFLQVELIEPGEQTGLAIHEYGQ